MHKTSTPIQDRKDYYGTSEGIKSTKGRKPEVGGGGSHSLGDDGNEERWCREHDLWIKTSGS